MTVFRVCGLAASKSAWSSDGARRRFGFNMSEDGLTSGLKLLLLTFLEVGEGGEECDLRWRRPNTALIMPQPPNLRSGEVSAINDEVYGGDNEIPLRS